MRALPKDLPEVLTADVSHLEIGQAIHIGEMKAPPGVEILGDKHIPVLSVAAPVSEAQEAAALEAATTPAGEVEMIKEKKEEGVEGEAKPAEKAPPRARRKPRPRAQRKRPSRARQKAPRKLRPSPARKPLPLPRRRSAGDKKPERRK